MGMGLRLEALRAAGAPLLAHSADQLFLQVFQLIMANSRDKNRNRLTFSLK